MYTQLIYVNLVHYLFMSTCTIPVLLCSLLTEGDVINLLKDCLLEIQRNQRMMLKRLSAREPQVLPWVSTQPMDDDKPSGSGVVNFLAPARALSICTDEEVDFLWETASGLEEDPSSAASTPQQSIMASPSRSAPSTPRDMIVISPSPPRLSSPPLVRFTSPPADHRHPRPRYMRCSHLRLCGSEYHRCRRHLRCTLCSQSGFLLSGHLRSLSPLISHW